MGGAVAGLLSTPTRAGTPDTRGLAASHPWLQLPGTSRVLTIGGGGGRIWSSISQSVYHATPVPQQAPEEFVFYLVG